MKLENDFALIIPFESVLLFNTFKYKIEVIDGERKN